MKFEDIQRVNETIKTLDVKGKEYAEVNQRIKAFRMLYPQGVIETELVSDELITDVNNKDYGSHICIFKATIGYRENGELFKLGTGTAYEKENSTFINKTSYIENCETSAVGRALAMCGIGIDTSVASAEEVQNAIKQQEESNTKPLEKETLKLQLEEIIANTDTDRDAVLKAYKVKDMNQMTMDQMQQAINHIAKKAA